MAENGFPINRGDIFLYNGQPSEYYIVTRIGKWSVRLRTVDDSSVRGTGIRSENRFGLVTLNNQQVDVESCQKMNLEELGSYFRVRFREIKAELSGL